jgi:hypothetical protein
MTRSFLQGIGYLPGLLPLLLLLFAGCGRGAPRGETRALEPHGLQVETPGGWTGGGSGGIYEFRSPDGTARVRIGPLEGTMVVGGLKEQQLLSGTGVTSVSRSFPISPTKVGPLVAERGRFITSDGRIYEIVAVQNPGHAVVLIQTSVSGEFAKSAPEDMERIFSNVRQSIQPLH